MNQQRLDARNLKCPLPVLRANKRLKEMERGAHLEVLVSEADMLQHFELFCDRNGHRLVESSAQTGEYHLLIEKC